MAIPQKPRNKIKTMKYLILILFAFGWMGCGGGINKQEAAKVDSSKIFYVLNGNDTLWFNSDTVFVINDSTLDYGEDVQMIDTIVVCDTIPIIQIENK